MDAFAAAYVTCALWSSHDDSDAYGGEPMDSNYGLEDIAPETLETMLADCADFQTANAETLEQAYRHAGYDEQQAGHDFWLTRNGHGAGFWDRGLGDVGDQLTAMAKPHGSFDLYVGDDGLVYGN